MKLLLDTHVFLWSLVQPERISPGTRAALADRANVVLFSIASAWEIGIKYALGKLTLPLPPAEILPHAVQQAGFEVAAIRLEHALAVSQLPHHHADPFDRMLIAQATIDGLTIVTVDAVFARYEVPILEFGREGGRSTR